MLDVQRKTYEQAVEHDLCRGKINPMQIQFFNNLALAVDKRIHFRHAALGLGQLNCCQSNVPKLHGVATRLLV